jgi:3-oxocholest-4-en-26-oate---CoA ligase
VETIYTALNTECRGSRARRNRARSQGSEEMGDVVAGWNFADMWEAVARVVPDAPANLHGERRTDWRAFDERADGIAATLLALGVERQDKVAQYLYNGPEYLESMFGAMKAGLVPVNTNYRYGDNELLHLWHDADVVAVVFHGAFSDRVERLRHQVPRVKGWIWVDDGSGPCPDWAVSYEEAASSAVGHGPVRGPWGRDGDDLYLLYTGGTTGMPKGVMWRQDDMFATMNAGSFGAQYPENGDATSVPAVLTEPGIVGLPASPLMHGTGAFTALAMLNIGGAVVTLTERTFDAEELLDAVERHRVAVVSIVGDALAKPILRALDANPGRWDLSSIVAMVSSGVMWSEQTKQGLLAHHGAMAVVDALSSSEALGMGQSQSVVGDAAHTASFTLGENAILVDDDGRPITEPGLPGRVAVRGRVPIGYYKDPEKSARTFLVIDGNRYSVPGDYAVVEEDGTLHLLGRGSVCINTGGEKVFPEEVEEALKTHPAVHDAVAVAVPDERWGEAVTAVIEAVPGATIDESDVVAHVRQRLAAFKTPKRLVVVDTIGRGPNGKVDYRRLRDEAVARLDGQPSASG